METNTNISQELLETIERYLNNSLKTDERAAFEKKLKTDPKLKPMLEEVKRTHLAIESASLKNKLNDYHSDMIKVKKLTSDTSSKTTKRFPSKLFQLLIAASIVFAFGIFYFMNQASPSEKLFAKYFKVDPGLPTTMSTSADYDFYDAMVSYKREEYSVAIQKWEMLLSEKPHNDTLNYFLGVANLAIGKELDAIKYLKVASEDKNSFLKDDTYLYLGLAYLKVEDIDKAKVSFNNCNKGLCKDILSEINN